VGDGLIGDIVSVIDPSSAFALAVALLSQDHTPSLPALDAVLDVLPNKPDVLLSGRGAEFEAGFAQTLAARPIARWYTDPKTPEMTARGTLQPHPPGVFRRRPRRLRSTDLNRFSQKLADWLVFYNAQRPHHRLGQRPPLSFLLQFQPECQRG
jgi:transposase InsO family protein